MIDDMESENLYNQESPESDSAFVVVDQDELFQRLTDWAYERVDIDSAVIAATVVDALNQDGEQARLAEGEILVPDAGELVVIQETVQAILSFFQEDDHDVLSDIRDDVSGIRAYLENQGAANGDLRGMMTTNFADYTVTEGLLLLILLFMIIQFCIRMLKGGFSWLA